MKALKLLSVLTLLIVGGCSTVTPWGNYEHNLFKYYESPETTTQFKQETESHLKECERSNIKPAPGLYAEVGTLCLKQANYECAIEFYQKEKLNWPESEVFMDKLIRSTKRVSEK